MHVTLWRANWPLMEIPSLPIPFMSFPQMKFPVKVTVGFGMALLAFASISVFSYRSAVLYDNDRGWVTHTHLVLEGIGTVSSDVTGAETGQRGFLLTGDESYLQSYMLGKNHVGEDLRTLRDLTADNPVQQHNLDRLEPLIAATLEVMQNRVAIRRQKGLGVAVDTVKLSAGKDLMEKIRDLTLAMKAEETRLLQQRMEKATSASLRTRAVIIFGNTLALLFLALAGFMIQKEMNARRRGQDEIKRLNHDLEQRVNELTVANRELDAFTHSLAHDLRAPLRHMHGFAELLRERWYEKLDDDGRHFLKKVLASSGEMGTLVDDLLNFSRLARVEVQAGVVNPQELLDRAMQELEPETRGRSIDWEIGPLPDVRADPALLYQALFNLLANAVKYTRKCAMAQIQIGSTGADNEGLITVFIRDNGAGFDMQYKDKLFRVFQRLHRAEDFEGTGVGLANVRRIIERHGGSVWAEGAVGLGATFYFSIPAAPLPTLALPVRRQNDEPARLHSVGR
jgi:signal transduction histidine kinase